MIRVNIWDTAGNEYEYTTDDDINDDGLATIKSQGANSVVLLLKNGTTEEFYNVCYSIRTEPDPSQLITKF